MTRLRFGEDVPCRQCRGHGFLVDHGDMRGRVPPTVREIRREFAGLTLRGVTRCERCDGRGVTTPTLADQRPVWA